MTWNYKIIANTYKGEDYFQIHEVYYDEYGIATGTTMEAATVFSEDGIDGIKKVLKMMNRATKEPALWGDKRFPEEYIK